MSKLKTVTVCGVTMSAETITLARAAAEANATAAIRAVSQAPAIYLVHGLTVIVYPVMGPHCLSYNYDVVDPAAPRSASGFETKGLCASGRDRDETISGAILHAAQNAWDVDVDDETFIAALPYYTTQATKAELRSWAAWQRRYKAVFAIVGNDAKSHEIASHHRTLDEAIAAAVAAAPVFI